MRDPRAPSAPILVGDELEEFKREQELAWAAKQALAPAREHLLAVMGKGLDPDIEAELKRARVAMEASLKYIPADDLRLMEAQMTAMRKAQSVVADPEKTVLISVPGMGKPN